MLRLLRNRKAQNTAEYAILIGIVVAAAITVQTYVKRGMQGRVKDAGDDLYDAVANATIWTNVSNYSQTPTILGSKQWEPGMNSTSGLKQSTTETLLDDDETIDLYAGGDAGRNITTRTQANVSDYRDYNYTLNQ